MVRILFICHGNICRSPMAEYVMKDLVQKAGLESDFVISSRATHYDALGDGVYPPARRILHQHGIHCDGHCATRLEQQDYANWDYMIGMDQANLKNIHRICGGDPDGKISLLLDHAGIHRDVADPWYTGNFEATWHDVLTGCTALFKKLR